ncbi:unnamed protein product [Pleuronectes platessa]|uniref:Uncharacterized protein n=1 Tax=Pleuronectes platessa TaxID=8262 RepID=A0A9N7U0A7_PLEPL|nr:unnamed protein product [Pleuronectes platessa]
MGGEEERKGERVRCGDERERTGEDRKMKRKQEKMWKVRYRGGNEKIGRGRGEDDEEKEGEDGESDVEERKERRERFKRSDPQRQREGQTAQVRRDHQLIGSVYVCLFVLMSICQCGADNHGNTRGGSLPRAHGRSEASTARDRSGLRREETGKERRQEIGLDGTGNTREEKDREETENVAH